MNRKWLVLISVGTGTFMTALDSSVVNAVLPLINQTFGGNISLIQWVVTIYLLTVSGLLLSFGRIGDIKGHRQIYLMGFVIFIVGSALCGVAPSIELLIASRAFQALGAAMLASNSPAILTKSFPANQRGQALGLQATMTYLGLTLAPSLGGWLAQSISWRTVFYINLPIGLLALGLSWRFVPSDQPIKRRERFDIFGALTFLLGLVALLLSLNQGHALGWTSSWIIGLFMIAILLLIFFVFIEQNHPQPMLDLALFKRTTFSTSVISAMMNYICIYSILFLLPFYLIQGREFNPAYAGMILTIQPIVMAIVAPISGILSDHIGVQYPGTLGLFTLGIGIYMLSRLGSNSSILDIAKALSIVGLGTGIFISPNNSALMGSAPHNRQGIAAGVMATARSVGMVMGVGIAGAIFSTALRNHQSLPENARFIIATQTSLLPMVVFSMIGLISTAIRGKNYREK
jgi:EmrB/QacA subfamily drug resistance transporter